VIETELRDWTLSCYVVNTSNDTKRVTTKKNKKDAECLTVEWLLLTNLQNHFNLKSNTYNNICMKMNILN